MELSERTIGIWFVPIRSPAGDWMAALNRDSERSFTATFRFRWYDPDDPANDAFSGQDRKSWYQAKSKDITEAEAVESIRMIADGMAIHAGCEPTELMMGEGGVEELLERMAQQSWAHIKMLN